MKKCNFKEMDLEERKAKFFSVLSEKTKGGLTQEEIDKIISSVGVDNQYQVKVINSEEEYLNQCIALDLKTTSSKLGAKGIKTVIKNILNDNVVLGCEKIRTRDEDDKDENCYELTESYFKDSSKPSAVFKEVKDWSCWIDQKYSNVYRYILIYIPKIN